MTPIKGGLCCFLLMLWHSSSAQENTGICTQENLDKCFQRFDFTDDVSKHPFSFAGTNIDKLCGEYNFFVGCVIEFEEDCPSKHGRRIMATRGAMHYVCDSKLYHGDREAWTDEYACVRKIDSKLESECSSAYHQGLQQLDVTNLGFDNLTPSNVELFHELCGVRLEYQRCTKALGRSECDEDMERILYEYTRVITQGDFDTSHCVDGHLDQSVTGGTTVKSSRIHGWTVPPTSDPTVKTNKETEEPKKKKGHNSVGIGLGIFVVMIVVVAAAVLIVAYRRSRRRGTEGKTIMPSEGISYSDSYNNA